MHASFRTSDIEDRSNVLFPPASVTRTPKLGALQVDRSTIAKFGWKRYRGPYSVDFPEIRVRFVDEALLAEETVPICKGTVISDNFIGYSGAGELLPWVLERIAKAEAAVNAAPQIQDVEGLTLIVHNEGGGTWGHWVVQNLPRAILFLKHHPHGRVALPRSYRTNNFGACLALFGIAPEAVVEIVPNTVYRFETAAFIDHLYDHSGVVHPAVIDILAGATLPDTEEMSPPRFFMDRVTQAVRRNIENIDAAAAVMHRHGFARGRISLAPVAKQAATWRAATHFLSILGSDMTNLVFAKPGSHVISITPDFHNDMFFFDLAAAKGMVWHELLCGEIATRREPVTHSSFDVRPEALDAVLRTACSA